MINKKNITIGFFIIAGLFASYKYFFDNSSTEFDPFLIKGEVVVQQQDFLKNRNINFPIETGQDAIKVIVAATDMMKKIVIYRQAKVSHKVWEAIAKRNSEHNWLVVFREKGANSNYACWAIVDSLSAEPTPLQCIKK